MLTALLASPILHMILMVSGGVATTMTGVNLVTMALGKGDTKFGHATAALGADSMKLWNLLTKAGVK